MEPQPVPRLLSRVFLLLRQTFPRVLGVRRRHGFRLEDRDQAPGARSAARRLPQSFLAGRTDRVFWEHGLLSALEATYGLTRGCLEVCAEFRNPVGIITKAALVVRDLELLKRLHTEA